MASPDKILDAARAIVPELPALLSDETAAASLAQQLSALLDVPDPKSNLKEIKQLLLADEKTKAWVKDAIAGDTLSFPRSVGDAGSPENAIYVCPVEGCNETWVRRSSAQAIPHCPQHPQHTFILKK